MRYTGSLTISGVIDEADARDLGTALNNCTYHQMSQAIDHILDGEQQFFFFKSSSDPALHQEIKAACDRLHLSFHWAALAIGDHEGQIHMRDLELGIERRFPAVGEETLITQAQAEDPQVQSLFTRWPSADDAPALILVQSHHHALDLAGPDSDHRKAALAYLDRRRARVA